MGRQRRREGADPPDPRPRRTARDLRCGRVASKDYDIGRARNPWASRSSLLELQMVPLRPLALMCAGLALVSCTSKTSSSITLPAFDDVYQAPAAIQTAAQAVVLVQIAGGMATGSFLSPDGLFLTNNHVLGVDVCFREGCCAQIQRMYQRHATPLSPETVFVSPLAIDIGNDLALVQLYDGASPTTKVSSPHLSSNLLRHSRGLDWPAHQRRGSSRGGPQEVESGRGRRRQRNLGLLDGIHPAGQ